MSLKTDSSILIPARTRKGGDSSCVFGGVRWAVVDGVRCLGAWVSCTGEDKTERSYLMNAWSRMFWATARILTNRLASIKSRMRFWRSLLYGISDHRFVSIRPVKTNVAALETASNKLLRFIVGARPNAEDTRESFCIRRNHLISLSKRECKLDVRHRLCWKLVTWVEHVWRHKQSRAFILLQVHDDCFLQTIRAFVGIHLAIVRSSLVPRALELLLGFLFAGRLGGWKRLGVLAGAGIILAKTNSDPRRKH